MAEAAPRPQASAGLRMTLDYGPLIVFFGANAIASGPVLARVMVATLAFMIAMTIAMAVSWWKLRRVSPMLLITGVLVLVFGGLTLYFHSQTFIQIKPTFVYAMFALLLGYGLIADQPAFSWILGRSLVRDKPLLQLMLEGAYPGLSSKGWRLLTINWMVFFVVMAVANEVARHMLTWDRWVFFKTWIVIPLTLVFAIANIPMLLRHGLQLEKPEDAPLPPEG